MELKEWRSEPNVFVGGSRVIDINSFTVRALTNASLGGRQMRASRASTPSAWNGSQQGVTVTKRDSGSSTRLPPALPPGVVVDKTFRKRSSSVIKSSLPPIGPDLAMPPSTTIIPAEDRGMFVMEEPVVEPIDVSSEMNPAMEMNAPAALEKSLLTEPQYHETPPSPSPFNESASHRHQTPIIPTPQPPAVTIAELEETTRIHQAATPAPTCLFPETKSQALGIQANNARGACARILKPLQTRVVEFPESKPSRQAVYVKRIDISHMESKNTAKIIVPDAKVSALLDRTEAIRRSSEAKHLLNVMWETRQHHTPVFFMSQQKQQPVSLLDINRALPQKFPIISAGGDGDRIKLPQLEPLPGIGMDVLRRQIWCPSKEDLDGRLERKEESTAGTRRLFSASKIWKTSLDRRNHVPIIKSEESIATIIDEIIPAETDEPLPAPQAADSSSEWIDLDPPSHYLRKRRRRLFPAANERRRLVPTRPFSAIQNVATPTPTVKPKLWPKLPVGARPQPPIPKRIGRSLPNIMAEMNEVLNNLMFVQPEPVTCVEEQRKREKNAGNTRTALMSRGRYRTRVPRCKSAGRPEDTFENGGKRPDKEEVRKEPADDQDEKSHKVDPRKLLQKARNDYDFYHLHKEDYFESLHMNEVELARPPPNTTRLIKRNAHLVTYTTDGWADLHEISTPERSKLLYVHSDHVTIRPATSPATTQHNRHNLHTRTSTPGPTYREAGEAALELSGANVRIREMVEVLPPPPSRRREVVNVLAVVDKKTRKRRVPYNPNPRHAILRSRGIMSPRAFSSTRRMSRRKTVVVIDYLSMRKARSREKEEVRRKSPKERIESAHQESTDSAEAAEMRDQVPANSESVFRTASNFSIGKGRKSRKGGAGNRLSGKNVREESKGTSSVGIGEGGRIGSGGRRRRSIRPDARDFVEEPVVAVVPEQKVKFI
ncbi:hypothetical protein HDU67_000202 [Dinochytrium kinnereticum]|nr:hypothetical protein HDU67_000202 [Dinochytrium kinnereticum]